MQWEDPHLIGANAQDNERAALVCSWVRQSVWRLHANQSDNPTGKQRGRQSAWQLHSSEIDMNNNFVVVVVVYNDQQLISIIYQYPGFAIVVGVSQIIAIMP